jgi:hypothetical protein
MYWCLQREYDDIVGLSEGLKEGKDLMSNGEILILRLLLCLFDLK